MIASQTFSLQMGLVVRTPMGVDTWGQPLMEEKVVPFKGYYYQWAADDADNTGTVSMETGKVLMMADDVAAHRPHEWHAIEMDSRVEDPPRRLEIIGAPEPKFSMARGGKIHHWELVVSRGQA